MARTARPVEVVDLVSSDDERSPTPPIKREAPADGIPANRSLNMRDFDLPQAYAQHGPRPASPQQQNDRQTNFPPPPRFEPNLGGTFVVVDGEEVFIPDEIEEDRFMPDAAPLPPAGSAAFPTDEDIALALAEDILPNSTGARVATEEPAPAGPITADDCLQRVLSIFPDIRHEYVYNLYAAFDEQNDYETLPGQARLDNIVDQLISDPNYPKQEKGKKTLKRKREEEDDDVSVKKFDREDRAPLPHFLKASMQAMLKAEFVEIPIHYIKETLAREKHLFQAYMALAKDNDKTTRPYSRGRASKRALADADTIATNCGWPELLEELNAARKQRKVIVATQAAEAKAKEAEKKNLDHAIAAGEVADCTVCFDALPMNRQIHCNGSTAHFICYDCAEMYIKTEVGDSRCPVRCCTDGCGSGFANNQFRLLPDTCKQPLEKLAQLQQEKDIRDAGLEDLEECPFCEYKAIMPPIDEDFEFRCANPECEKVSCRRCKSASHIPVSCEQHAKDNKINSRHKVEEAMTAALVRSCNKCKKKFIKEMGCNKMSCPSCGNLQCYVCSSTVTNYEHFDQNARPGVRSTSKLCPLYDNVEERHEREVKEAEAAARAQVVQDNPDVTMEDLEIKVSDRVKQSAAKRTAQADPHGLYAGPAFNALADRLYGVIGNRHAARARDGDGEHDDDAAVGYEELGEMIRNVRRQDADLARLGHGNRRGRMDAVRAGVGAIALDQRQIQAAARAPPIPAVQVQGYIPVVAAPAAGGLLLNPPRHLQPHHPFYAQHDVDFLNGLAIANNPPAPAYPHAIQQPQHAMPGAYPGFFDGFAAGRPRPQGLRDNFQELEALRRRHEEEIQRRARRRQEVDLDVLMGQVREANRR